jgi:hypothetical protein
VGAEVQWGQFRGRLRRALRSTDPEIAEVESEKPTAADVERETGGKVKAAVINEYIDGTRADLPKRYLPHLLSMEALKLTHRDYSVNSALSPTPLVPKPANQSPAQTAVRARVNRTEAVRRDVLAKMRKPHYVSLYCNDPEAMRAALRNRIARAHTNVSALGRSFNLTMHRSHCQEFNNFMTKLAEHGLAPAFAAKLQDRFWEICEFLNAEIRMHEAGHPQSTEQFIETLLTEGSMENVGKTIRMLREINEVYQRRIPSHSR